MSGAPVVAADQLLGVVTVHAPRKGRQRSRPSLDGAWPDPAHPRWGPGVKDAAAWWARLGVTGLADLQRLPAPIERPDGVKPSLLPPTSGTLLEEDAVERLVTSLRRQITGEGAGSAIAVIWGQPGIGKSASQRVGHTLRKRRLFRTVALCRLARRRAQTPSSGPEGGPRRFLQAFDIPGSQIAQALMSEGTSIVITWQAAGC